MYRNDQLPREGPRSGPTENCLPTPRLHRAASMLGGVLCAALLGGCSGPLLVQPDAADEAGARQAAAAREARAYADSLRAARTAVAVDKQARARPMTARQIAAEWGTWLFKRTSDGSAKGSGGRQRRQVAGAPAGDDSISIREIMAGAACGACEHKPYHHLVMQASNQHGVPASLIHAVIQKESGYNPAATSSQNARGLMQITPGTGKYMGVENSLHLYDPRTNIDAGTAYLKYLMRSHDTVDEVLAAYNSGPGNVRKYNGVPPFSETRRYVRDVKTVFAFTANME